MTRIEKAIIRDSKVLTDMGEQVELQSMERTGNKDASIPDTPTNGHYPTTEAVKTYVDGKVSGVYKYRGEIEGQDDFNVLINGTSTKFPTVAIGDVFNLKSAVSYTEEGKTEMFLAGTNIAIKEVGPPRKVDALAGFVDISNKTDRAVTLDDGGLSLISNLKSDEGAVMQFTHKDGTKSAIAVNNGGVNGIAGQLYVINKDNASEGCKINMEKSMFTYIKNKATSERNENDEIAVKGDIPKDTIKLLGDEPGSGEPYHFPFNINAIVQNADTISTTFDTITLDNNETKKSYPIAIPSADPTNNKAGLYTQELANKKIDKLPLETYSQTEYKFPFHIEVPVQNERNISVKFHTLEINNGTERAQYTMSLPLADTTNGKAGLYNKELADVKVNVSDVINGLQSAETQKPLSAKMGSVLSTRIDNISTLGRYLSTWDCTTGLPGDNPPTGMPYDYKTGDYFVVSKVAESTSGTNYKPDGSQYIGKASTVEQTGEVKINYYYRYDASGWQLVKQDVKGVTFSSLAGSPDDNTALKQALDGKSKVTVSATGTATDTIEYITVDNIEKKITVTLAEVGNTEIDAMWS